MKRNSSGISLTNDEPINNGAFKFQTSNTNLILNKNSSNMASQLSLLDNGSPIKEHLLIEKPHSKLEVKEIPIKE